jgi:hypothetical protein
MRKNDERGIMEYRNVGKMGMVTRNPLGGACVCMPWTSRCSSLPNSYGVFAQYSMIPTFHHSNEVYTRRSYEI